ncbi:MAG: hypothetical protein IPO18_09510 [bacterium]|nr:hypothetical protein [bacterium]
MATEPPFMATPLAKLGTGVDGLDEVLDGGYPKGRTTMIRGGPGAGKTLFALQFLVQSARQGTAGIFITFEESAEAIRMNAATLGWDLPALERIGLLFIHHARLDPAAVVSGPYSLSGMMAIIDGKAKALGARQLVIDAIDIVMRRFEDVTRARDEINSLHEWLDENGYTTLLSVKLNDDPDLASRFSFLDYMADCVVRLDHRVMEQISTRRLRVQKYRGSSFGDERVPVRHRQQRDLAGPHRLGPARAPPVGRPPVERQPGTGRGPRRRVPAQFLRPDRRRQRHRARPPWLAPSSRRRARGGPGTLHQLRGISGGPADGGPPARASTWRPPSMLET